MSTSPSPETDASSQAPAVGLTVVPAQPTVREIHKNGWLKRLPQTDKRPTPFAKHQKPEKMWIVFCIHDDVEAFLEYYENHRSAFSHRPIHRIALANCLHISPNIVVQENDYVFSITMENQVIKLAASTREQMTEWIDTLRGKLTELGVLSPPNNLYSVAPEVKPILAPNRDPNSPLPIPPAQSVPFFISTESHSNNSRGMPNARIQENGNSNVVSHELQPSQPRRMDAPTNNPSTAQTGSISRFQRHSPSPLPTAREESENRAITPALSSITTHNSQFSIEAGVSPTTSVTALNVYTNIICNARSGTSEENLRSNVEDSNGNDPTEHVIYEPLCLASTAASPYVNIPASQNHAANRRDLNRSSSQPQRANDTERDHLRLNINSEYTNATSSNQGENNFGNGSLVNNAHEEISRPMTLKEKQVFQLRYEISHKAGVSLNLPKRDCVNSIAFAEHFGHLWICGWKQRDHPLLYHNFHIGDRLISVAGHSVNSTHDFNRILKAENSSKVEFVIRRLPYGKAIAIRRECEGQDLGIIRDGNTAEIVEVIEGGLAAKHGLSAKSQSIIDSHGPCNWTLTEINGRPLNLFFKDIEIQDRLNAVGKDISILVQPSEFVKILKKQLRAMWNYKDYIVQ